MDDNRNASFGQNLRRLDKMVLVCVHTAGRGQPRKVRCATRTLHRRREPEQRRVFAKRPVRNCVVDLWQIHPDNPSGTDIRMPDLGIAHLSFRQANLRPVRRKRRVRAFRHNPVKAGRIGQRYGIRLAFRPQAPTVENA